MIKEFQDFVDFIEKNTTMEVDQNDFEYIVVRDENYRTFDKFSIDRVYNQSAPDSFQYQMSDEDYWQEDLDNYFEDPIRPSPEECILYELEKGKSYMLLKYLKPRYKQQLGLLRTQQEVHEILDREFEGDAEDVFSDEGSGYVRFHFNLYKGEKVTYLDFYFNVTPDEVARCGQYELRDHKSQWYHLERSFVDPLYPTPDELVLFELEHGEEYYLEKARRTPDDN